MIRKAVVPFLLAGLAACSNTKTVYLHGGESVNPDPNTKVATPVQVKVYQLVSKEQFEGANFRDIWEKPKETLGGALATETVEERSIDPCPKGKKPSDFEDKYKVDFVEEKSLDTKTLFFGVAANYNPPEGFKEEAKGDWKKVVSVEECSSWAFLMDNYEVIKKER